MDLHEFHLITGSQIHYNAMDRVVCKTWAGLIGLVLILGWALLNFVLGWAQIWARFD